MNVPLPGRASGAFMGPFVQMVIPQQMQNGMDGQISQLPSVPSGRIPWPGPWTRSREMAISPRGTRPVAGSRLLPAKSVRQLAGSEVRTWGTRAHRWPGPSAAVAWLMARMPSSSVTRTLDLARRPGHALCLPARCCDAFSDVYRLRLTVRSERALQNTNDNLVFHMVPFFLARDVLGGSLPARLRCSNAVVGRDDPLHQRVPDHIAGRQAADGDIRDMLQHPHRVLQAAGLVRRAGRSG